MCEYVCKRVEIELLNFAEIFDSYLFCRVAGHAGMKHPPKRNYAPLIVCPTSLMEYLIAGKS